MKHKSKVIRLMIDCDGVLADFTGGALRVYKGVTGRTMDPNSIKEWNFTGSLEFENTLQKELFHRCLRAPGFAMSLDPTPGSKEAMKEIRTMADVHVVTSPLSGSMTWTYERELWLAMHYGIPHTRVHHSQAKFVHSADLFVDDKPEHVREWADYNETGAAFLWDAPSNRLEKDLSRIHSWGELIELFRVRRRP